uniref:ATP synthase F0 subunit 8 n=1 Tax=Eucorysses grandis TaxID=1176171 RepID=A0A2P1CLR9_9HEMI|nr:ATP synthase F0 subunit 8 [Eucorysses grandis]AVJ52274.1 ATP synthase F0 subunit 8 [Eucorysses grandis]
MPQMAPLYWEFLFIMFIMSMIMMMIIIFHMTWMKIEKKFNNNKIIKQFNWKW